MAIHFSHTIIIIIICHSISTGAEPAVLKSDWSRAGLRVDLPVFVYSYTKTGYQVHSNALENILWNAEIHRQQYFVKTCMTLLRKVLELLGNLFSEKPNVSENGEKNVFDSN